MTNDNPSAERLTGPQTAAAVDNFAVSGEPVPLAIIDALLHVKWAAASANATIGDPPTVDPEIARGICSAIEDVLGVDHAHHFPVDVYQTGSGTSTNMNVNEVVATLASRQLGRPVHPNDHVNASQSTNDTFPTALHLACLLEFRDVLEPAVQELIQELRTKSDEFSRVVKAGRTHLMDATPIMLGDEFGGYASQLRSCLERLSDGTKRLRELALGGTATGNGLNAPAGFASLSIELLGARLGLDLLETRDHFAAQGSQDALVEWSSHLRGLAVALYKIANDLRLLSSGPYTGLGEISLPALQAGSSIMPGKVNPVICESVMQICAQSFGNDAAVAFAGTQGNLELNVFLPLIGRNVIQTSGLLAAGASHLAQRAVRGIEADVERCLRHAESTAALATALNREVGYDTATQFVKEAAATGRSVLDVVTASGVLDAQAARRLLDVEPMARPPR